ncbi:MAG: three-Cys-motif partner protein TcmP [Bacteroidota bacterium]
MSTENINRVSEPQAEYLPEDGLVTPPVGAWAEYKYRFIGFYNRIFSTGMKERWDKRVYIDLFAGAGRARTKKTNKIVLTSPLIALSVPDKYDRYIFCDNDERNLDALQQRVRRDYPEVDVHFVLGDCNKKVDEIIGLMPQYSKTNKVLSFCFVDPFSLKIDFETIQTLSQYFADFLILLALAMDANRNEARYAAENNETIDKFLGLSDWRERWKLTSRKDTSFRRFLAQEYAGQMIKLRYLDESLSSMIEVRSDDRNLPLYHLAFFSRHERGYKFWQEAKHYIDEPELPFC